MTPGSFVSLAMIAGFLACSAGAVGQTTWHVDDNSPGDPGPGNPAISDPAEDGSALASARDEDS